jgi:6-phosphogluconolactonase
VEIGEPGRLAAAFVARLESEARAALARHGRFALALTGGSVARAFLPALADADVDWRRTDLFWSDERAVPPEHPESNFGLARELWLDRAAVAPRGLHRLAGEVADLAAAAAAAAGELDAWLAAGPHASIDFALAGFGADGHLASLFPGHPALAERERRVVAVEGAPKPPPRRLTWTLAAFARVDLLVVAGWGVEKATAAHAALRGGGAARSPLALAARAAARRLFLLDEAAGGGERTGAD